MQVRLNVIYWDGTRNFIYRDRTRRCLSAVNRRTGCIEFAAERVVISVFPVVRFRMSVRSGAHILEVRFR